MSSEEEADFDEGNFEGFDDTDSDADAGARGSGGGGAQRAGVKRKRPAVASELAPERLAEFAAGEKRKGLVYLPRIPPGMKPIKIRHMLSRYGELGRIYLSPEDPLGRTKRVKAGGNKKERFTEGWVEFLDKSVAQGMAEVLNNTPIDEGKRGFYSADLWNTKFLPHFKWHHLTEKLTYERRIKRDKLRAELSKVRKDAEAYVDKAESAKRIRKMEERKRTAGGGMGGGKEGGGAPPFPPPAGGVDADAQQQRERIRRTFKQHAVLPDATMRAIGATAGTATGGGKRSAGGRET